MARRKVKRGYPARLGGGYATLELWNLGANGASSTQQRGVSPTTQTQKESKTMVAPTMQREDVSFEEFSSTGERLESVPEDTYILELGDWTTVDKRPRDIEWEAAQRGKPAEDIDPKQWKLEFLIVKGVDSGEEHTGAIQHVYVNRTFHRNSTAGKIVAALLGMEEYIPDLIMSMGFTGTKSLLGKRLKADITEKKTDNGSYNKVGNFRRIPPAKGKAKEAAPIVDEQFDEVPNFNDGVPNNAATDKQVKAIYAIGRAAKRFSEGQVDDAAIEAFGIRPVEMTRVEASEFIDMLKGEAAD